LNRISFADFQFPLAGTLFNERGGKKLVMEKATSFDELSQEVKDKIENEKYCQQ